MKIQGKQHYLWRAVDQDSEVVDVFLQAQRFLSTHAAVTLNLSGPDGITRIFDKLYELSCRPNDCGAAMPIVG